MSLRDAASRLRARPWLVVAGGVVALSGPVAAVLGLFAAIPFYPSSAGFHVDLVALVLFGLVPAMLVRPAPLAVLYAIVRTEEFGIREVPAAVRTGYPRLLAGSVAGHAVAVALLPVAFLVAAPFALVATGALGLVAPSVDPLAARPLQESTLEAVGFGVVGLGFSLAYLPASFADLLVLDGDGDRWTPRGVVRAPLDSIGVLFARAGWSSNYLVVRTGATLLAAGVAVAGVFVALETIDLSAPGTAGVVFLTVSVLAVCRSLVGVLHVDTFERTVEPAVTSGAAPAARSRRWLAAVALVGLLVTVPVVAAGAATYGSGVSSAYDVSEAPEPATPYAYEGNFTVEGPNGDERELFTVHRTTTENWTLVRWTDHEDGVDWVAVNDGPFVYRVTHTSSQEQFDDRADASNSRSWHHAVNATGTIYSQRWGDVGLEYLKPAAIAERFAYRRVGTTTYRGIRAVEYEPKSWLLPRDGRHRPGQGRVLVAEETGEVLRIDVTTTDDDTRYHVDYASRRVSDPDGTAAREVVRAVERNVTIDPALYPTRYDSAPGVAAFRSGGLVGATFYLDDGRVTIPAGATVTAVGTDGTNYTTTLEESVTPTAGGVPLSFDLVFELRDDGRLDRRRPDRLSPTPEADRPSASRLVVRDESTGLTYVDANVTDVPLRRVTFAGRSNDGNRYVEMATIPQSTPFYLEVESVETGEVVFADTMSLIRSGYLQWWTHDTVIVTSDPYRDRIVDDNGSVERRYVVSVYGPRGLLKERTVTLSRPRPVTETPRAG